MAIPKLQREALTLARLRDLLDPGRVYYRPVVFDILQRADATELKALVAGVKDLKAEYGDLDGIIKAAEGALRKAKG
ncbi:hypothetical protein [Sphingomonas alpina]|uniref:Uncharacterized protein n=1 Tax=Sphingomonas alpina TaxID=653931 RepID=A0A7H0LFI8_9SPHN|nr:hypothetical protein [Sphingomonas alpina]QNQ08441.1 hypothetical protein H3Z74_17035 [Sphingomonas alpina]